MKDVAVVGRSANYALRRKMIARTAGVECFIGSDDEEHCSGSSGSPEPASVGDAEISEFCAGPVNGCKQCILRELLCSVFFGVGVDLHVSLLLSMDQAGCDFQWATSELKITRLQSVPQTVHTELCDFNRGFPSGLTRYCGRQAQRRSN